MNEQIRAEFEEWWDSTTNNNGGVAYYVCTGGKYCFDDIEQAWQTWQAAHARYAGSGEAVDADIHQLTENLLKQFIGLDFRTSPDIDRCRTIIRRALRTRYTHPPAQPKVPEVMQWADDHSFIVNGPNPEEVNRCVKLADLKAMLSAQENSK